jgi:putative thioredoxin
MSDFIVTVTEQNVVEVVIEASKERPVLVDFWAEWCEPCKTIMPMLEALANEYDGQFVLAKVNADEQQNIAQQFGVKSLPTVMLIKDGQPVDGFVGAQPENQVRELLSKYLPKPWDAILQQAEESIAEGDFNAALAPLRQAYTDSNQQLDIAFSYARVLIELNRCDEAEAILSEIRMADQDAEYEQLKSHLELRREAASAPEVQALEEQLSADPGNLDVSYQLAVQYSDHGQYKEGMESLISILRVDREYGDGAAKKALLDTIATLGKGDPLAVEYQRKLFGLLY